MSFAVQVDPTNPGQFFACCGLLELADRLWPGAEGRFAGGTFEVICAGELTTFVTRLVTAKLTALDEDDPTSTRVSIGEPFGDLRLDWWHDTTAGGKAMKVWAGRMESCRIAQAMQHAMRDERFSTPDLFDVGVIAYEPGDPDKKVEPYDFDSRRCQNAHSRDVGFSANDLGLTTTAHPAVELLCLVGLQLCLPAKTGEPRVYDYFTWAEPLGPNLLPAAVSGLLPHVGASGYRFENWYRTGQKKHKAFRSAVPHSKQGAQ